jgi:radical SAM superfamily enzyme YgiQ (UPF0313 family)
MPVHPAGLHQVAEAASQAGYEVRTLDRLEGGDAHGTVREVVSDFRPDLIGLSVRNIDNQDMDRPEFFLQAGRELVQVLRQASSAPIVLGGAGYSIFPEQILGYLGADCGLSGEGEHSFLRVLAALDGQDRLETIPGICLPDRGLVSPPLRTSSLDSCPLPDPSRIDSGLAASEDFWMPYQTRRGCPLGCSYCSTGRIEGRQIRKRSIETVVDNLSAFRASGISRFFLVDNTFNLPRSYAQDLCRRIIERQLDITWRAIIYPKHFDVQLARAMAEAGCRDAALGFESGSPEVLRALGKRFSPDEVRQASGALTEAGIKRVGFLLLGGPGETRASVRQSLDFVDSLDLEALKLTMGLRIYPGTPLAEQAVAEGVIEPSDSLLWPRFYLRPELAEWLPEVVEAFAADRPGLVVG